MAMAFKTVRVHDFWLERSTVSGVTSVLLHQVKGHTILDRSAGGTGIIITIIIHAKASPSTGQVLSGVGHPSCNATRKPWDTEQEELSD